MTAGPTTAAYFNNAGTSWPKAPGVEAAVRDALALPPWQTAEGIARAGAAAATFFSLPHRERFVFTSGCTSSLMLAIHGASWRAGDAVICSTLEHEALAGPLRALERSAGVELFVAPRAAEGPIDLGAVEQRLVEGGVRLIAVTHASNVTGESLPIDRLVELAHAHGALVLLDAAQTAGVVPIDVGALGVDAFAFAGHKGLLGPAGVGGLWVGPGLRLGVVTGSCAETAACPADPPPSWCEVGSANGPAIAGLDAALAWIAREGLAALRSRQVALMARLLAGLGSLESLSVLGHGDAFARSNAVSVLASGATPLELERRLRVDFDLHARAGEHCAPLAHATLGTQASGTLRLSLSPFQDEGDVDRLLDALSVAS